MSPQAQSLSAVESTKTWKDMADATTLGADAKHGRDLHNRLEAAFLIGFQAGEKCAADRIRDAALGKTGN
jgi:hypothetical protein